MRKLINLILENSRPTKTKTATDTLFNEPGVHTGDIVPAGGVDVSDARAQDATAPAPHPSTATAAETSQAFAVGAAPRINADLMRNGQMGNILRDLQNAAAQTPEVHGLAEPGFDTGVGLDAVTNAGLDDPLMIGQDQLRLPDGHREATNDNLPMVMHQTLMTVEDPEIDQSFDPKWHQIQNLPGYIQSAVRQLGTQVFRVFTNTPLDQIQMMCDLLNPPQHVKKMADWIVRHGVVEEQLSYDFRESMPAYAAMSGATVGRVYRVGGFQFLLMKDNGGRYIYGWAANDPRMTDRRNQAQLPSS